MTTSAATTAETAPPTIRYRGPGEGAELWGGTQADFVLDSPNLPAREVAVLLQDAAAEALAQAASTANSPEFREQVAHAVGEAWLRGRIAERARIDSISVIAAATLAEHPDLTAAAEALTATS